MPTLTTLLSGAKRPLWLDYGDYTAVLLANGTVPWLDLAAYVGMQRKAQGLLHSDVVQLPVGSVCAAWVAARPALRAEMESKKRSLFPLKALLADEGLREHLVEMARGLRACFDRQPLALACPSPRAWVAQAWRFAHGPDAAVDVSEDDTDGAAVYIADFLRAFGEAGVDVLLLQESGGNAPVLELYQPVLNVAAHYRWEAGVQSGTDIPGDGLAFVIGPSSSSGRAVMPEFWNSTSIPECPAQGFRHAWIPADAQPETVLRRLAELRT